MSTIYVPPRKKKDYNDSVLELEAIYGAYVASPTDLAGDDIAPALLFYVHPKQRRVHRLGRPRHVRQGSHSGQVAHHHLSPGGRQTIKKQTNKQTKQIDRQWEQ